MSSHSDPLAQILEFVTDPPREGSSPVSGALQEFVDTLNQSPWIRAELATGPLPQLRSVKIGPKYRRHEGGVLMSFWLAPDAVEFVGNRRRERFSTRDELLNFLSDFIKAPSFRATLQEYRSLTDQDVGATLRTQDMTTLTASDVIVQVPAAKHKELVELAHESPRSEIEVEVTLEEKPSLGRFQPKIRYKYLDSAGYGVRLSDRPEQKGNRLLLKGTVLSLDELS